MSKSKSTYCLLTPAKLEQTLDNLYRDWSVPPPMVIYTGLLGYVMFDFSMLGCSIDPSAKWWYHVPKRIKDTHYIVSLFKKHGNIKVHILAKDGIVIRYYDGTKHLYDVNDLNRKTINKLKQLNRY